MRDIRNGIEHKCPYCGYEVKWDWNRYWSDPDKGDGFIKGDKSFIEIKNSMGRITTFETDVEKEIDYGREVVYEKVGLLGCPKCGGVSFKFD